MVVSTRLTEGTDLEKRAGFSILLLVKSIRCEMWAQRWLEGKCWFDAEKLGFLLHCRIQFREKTMSEVRKSRLAVVFLSNLEFSVRKKWVICFDSFINSKLLFI